MCIFIYIVDWFVNSAPFFALNVPHFNIVMLTIDLQKYLHLAKSSSCRVILCTGLYAKRNESTGYEKQIKMACDIF